MSLAVSRSVHPTAVIGPDVEIDRDVQIGPFVIFEGPVRIGRGSVIEAYACLSGPLELGASNYVGYKAVLGKSPQSRAYQGEPTQLVIGDGNSFQEMVTVHRGTVEGGGLTQIGHRNTLQRGAHLGHDVRMGNDCLLAPEVLVAGHVEIGDDCELSSHVVIQQRVRIGRLVCFSGLGGSTKDVPPFLVQQGYNCVTGVNRKGMARAGLPPNAIHAIDQVFQTLLRGGRHHGEALDRAQAEWGRYPEVIEFLEFIRNSRIGVNYVRSEERRLWCA